MNNINTYQLANGLRIIHEVAPTEVVYCGYLLQVGTRNEREDQSGMAHFCEHMTFKGTHQRTAMRILNGLERVGGDLNAYTNKEETVYHATILRQDFAKALQLLTDIVFCSIYPQPEISKEVEIIADEIESYKDSPSELIYDEFESILFTGHPLGRDILGDVSALRALQSSDFAAYAHQYYVPANATFFVYGNLSFSHIVRMVTRYTAHLPSGQRSTITQPLPPYVRTERHVDRGTHQAHVILGNRAISASDDRYPAFYLLNNILGGPGMNTRLNVSLRERAGLVYAVESNLNCYTDTGAWSIYFGCDPEDVSQCLRLIDRVLHTLIEQPLSERQLLSAVRQAIGQVRIATDNFESYAMGMGKTYAHYEKVRSVAGFCQRLEALTSTEIQQVAQTFFASQDRSLLIYQ